LQIYDISGNIRYERRFFWVFG